MSDLTDRITREHEQTPVTRTRPMTEHGVCFCRDGEHAERTRWVRTSQSGRWTLAGAEDYIASVCGGRTDYHLVTRTVLAEYTPWKTATHQPAYGLHQPPLDSEQDHTLDAAEPHDHATPHGEQEATR